MFSKEMMAALEADGEKLRQLTGEDHGPVFLTDARFIPCEHCGSEGRIYFGQYEDERDGGPCPVCEGTGMVETRAESITIDDLQ
jgi:hypothetical protein